jgi:hypothetical protein
MGFNAYDKKQITTHLVRYFVSQTTSDTPASHPSPRSRDYDRGFSSCCSRVRRILAAPRNTIIVSKYDVSDHILQTLTLRIRVLCPRSRDCDCDHPPLDY